MIPGRLHGVVAVTLLALFMGVACGTETPLENTPWVLESWGAQGNLRAVLEGTEITAVFSSAEGRVTGSAGCNIYFASFEAKDNDLTVPSPIAVTEMYCGQPDTVMDQEREYLAALEAAESYEVKDGKLRVSYSPGQLLVFLIRKAERLP